MKFLNWLQLPRPSRPRLTLFLFSTPLLSAREYAHKKYRNQFFSVTFFKMLLSAAFLIIIISFAHQFMQPLNYVKLLIISPFIYLFTEFIGSLGQLVFRFSTKGVPPIHRNPLRSKTLGEFWGKRWNFWVRDWLRDISHFHRKNVERKIFLTFTVSGLFHEILVNFPHYLYTGEVSFGNMTLYFIIQALGLWIEKNWVNKMRPQVRWLYLWMVVILPAPLFLNRPLLIFFGIING